MLICNVNFLSRDTCYFYSWLVDFLSKVQASSKTFVAGTIFSGYSIAEEFMTFPRYVQERRGMAFLSNLLDLMNVRLYYFLCTIHLLSVKMESVHLLWHMACNIILWWCLHFMEPFAGHFLNHVDLVMIQWVPRRWCTLKACRNSIPADDCKSTMMRLVAPLTC